MKCIKCQAPLKGQQKKFCSKLCKGRYSNSWFNSGPKQKQKGIERKMQLLKLLGDAKCSVCGYNRNLACLSFHHKNPNEKKFLLNQHFCSMYSIERLSTEAKKCQVLCMNCHTEHHNPQHKMVGPVGLEPTTKAL